jgi:predicted nucleic acid-binding protein
MYFLDSYAIIEYLKGNSKFTKIIDNDTIYTSDFQLMEVYYFGIKDVDEEEAEKYYEAFASVKVLIPEKTLKNAMKTRLEFQKKGCNISYVDAIGYQYAVDNNLKFVTGDLAFKGLKSVEYLGK